jgi:hypothetical protein
MLAFWRVFAYLVGKNFTLYPKPKAETKHQKTDNNINPETERTKRKASQNLQQDS